MPVAVIAETYPRKRNNKVSNQHFPTGCVDKVEEVAGRVQRSFFLVFLWFIGH
jgi:hypothetical protein